MTHLENSIVRRKRVDVNPSDLRRLVSYDPETGVFTNLVNRGSRARAGSVAGYLDARSGYSRVRIDGIAYEAHRLAWLYMTGEWPYMVDHINGSRSDNRWSNLREVDASQNTMNRKVGKNNTSGCKGVWQTKNGKFRARIFARKKSFNLGTFPTFDEAEEAYNRAAVEHFGEHVRQCQTVKGAN